MALPPLTPVTIPVDPTVAIPVDAELHTPTPVPSVRFVVAPEHTVAVPEIVPVVETFYKSNHCIIQS